MPLPLPNLDTRRWSDLVDEARGLIPRYAPGWTDHNFHDPGITLIELLAWLVEQDVYRANRVPERHVRKFLALLGFDPAAPRPARVALTVTPGPAAAGLELPAGVVCTTEHISFRTLSALSLIDVTLSAVQVGDTSRIVDLTQRLRAGLSFAAFGPDPRPEDDPARQNALYLGFTFASGPKVGDPLDLWLRFDGLTAGEEERGRNVAEAAAQEAACRPQQPRTTCPNGEEPPADAGAQLPPHHSVRTIWEVFDGAGWRLFDPEAGDVEDDTRGFTLDGAVRLRFPAMPAATSVGSVAAELVYVRCRLAAGYPDVAPLLVDVATNTVSAEQTRPARSSFAIAPGVQPPPGGEPLPGETGALALTLGVDGRLTSFSFGAGVEGPQAMVLRYEPATATEAGELLVTLTCAGWGSGLPGQRVELADAPVAGGTAEMWTGSDEGMLRWRQRRDLDASAAPDADFALDASLGDVRFGDGERGRVVPHAAAILARYETTLGSAGNVRAHVDWSFAGADDLLNRVLLGLPDGTDLPEIVVENVGAASGGADEENAHHAAGRAAEELWAHESLVELAAGRPTLDQIEPARVLARRTPARATNVLDYERLALDVPGTAVARARAWAAVDPAFPRVRAAGTVTVLVLPHLPLGRPVPTPGLLAAVRRYLERRRLVGTRLIVAASDYVQVSVQASVQSKPGALTARVRQDVVAALDAFLDPLTGGPSGLGWPFGRDIYRSEILQVVDGAAGVDHVLSLELRAGEGTEQCTNVRVGPTALAVAGTHEVEVA